LSSLSTVLIEILYGTHRRDGIGSRLSPESRASYAATLFNLLLD
jgi:hypothetical protein